MARQTKQQLIALGILTPSLLASILNVSPTYIRKLCRSKLSSDKGSRLETFNVASRVGKNEHRIHPTSAIEYCRSALGLVDNQIPQILFEMEKNASRNSLKSISKHDSETENQELITQQDNPVGDIVIEETAVSEQEKETNPRSMVSDSAAK
jgi:hypothetical protein